MPDPAGKLDLPAGFSYTIVAKSGLWGQHPYNPLTRTLTLVALLPPHEVANDYDTPGVFDSPDNIAVSPLFGPFLAEDGDGLNHVLGIDRQGNPFAFARNRVVFHDGADLIFREFTGPTFSNDGRFLFANVQDPGITYAITRPWLGSR